MNPITRPPSTAADRRPEITDEEAVRAFARARFGAVEHERRLADGVHCCRCANGEALVALLHKADFEGAGLRAASEAHLFQDMVVARTARGRRVTVTPHHTREQVRREWADSQSRGRLRLTAWVAAPGVEFAKITLASAPVRSMVMKRSGCSEAIVWEQAMRLVLDENPAYIAHLLPYPAGLYEPAIAEAITHLPTRLRDYAREAATATMSGERQPNLGWRRDRHEGVAKGEMWRVANAIDHEVNRVRCRHLPLGTEVLVRSWEDDTIWRGRVERLELEHGLALVRIGYPPGYRSSPRRVDDPSCYPLERIVEPHNPLPGEAIRAARKGETPRLRQFDTDTEPASDGDSDA